MEVDTEAVLVDQAGQAVQAVQAGQDADQEAFQEAVEIDDFNIRYFCCPKSQDFDPCNPCDWLASLLSLIAFGGIFYVIKVVWLYLGVPTLPDLLEWIIS